MADQAYRDMWRAIVTYDSTARLTHDETVALTGLLPGPSVDVEQDTHGTHLSMVIPALTLRGAQDLAYAAASDAWRNTFDVDGWETAVRVLPEAVYQAELVRPSPVALAGVAEIAEMAGVSRQRAQQLTLLADFPAPVAVLKSTKVFTQDSVRAFLQRWPRIPRWAGHHAQAERALG